MMQEVADLVPTSEYEYAPFPFEYFNPVQSLLFRNLNEDSNFVIASPTSSGKTVCAEMVMFSSRKNGNAIYLCPIKALVEERVEDWGQNGNGILVLPLTSDHDASVVENLECRADIVVATYEMLASRARRGFGKYTPWIDDASCLVVDEAHFISSQGRGDHLENAIIAFASRNKKARIVCMSATLENGVDFSAWLSQLTGRDTSYIESDYRPCKLNVIYKVFESYNPHTGRGLTYPQKEQTKIDLAIQSIEDHPDDQWLLFVHGKKIGKDLLKSLQDTFPLVPSAFHNADRTKEERKVIEQNFKKGIIRYLVATSTLAYGVNLPARRVAILGVDRGFSSVDPTDIIQECGRAGRPKYDTEGDATIILQTKQFKLWRNFIEKGVTLNSILVENMGFHLLGEIHAKRVAKIEDAESWLSKSLANIQGMWDRRDIEYTLKFLEEKSVIAKEKDFEGNELGYTVKTLGMITSYFYFDPKDTVLWRDILVQLRNKDLLDDEDSLCILVGANRSQDGYIPKQFKEIATEFLAKIKPTKILVPNDYSLFRAAVLSVLAKGMVRNPSVAMAAAGIAQDLERIVTCIAQIEKRCLGIQRPRLFWPIFRSQVMYGVPKRQALLCCIPGVGKVYSGKLMERGVTNLTEFVKKRSIAEKVLPEGGYEKGLKWIHGLRTNQRV